MNRAPRHRPETSLAAVADRFRPEAYTVTAVLTRRDAAAYDRLLTDTYEPLGFLSERVLPGADSRRYLIRYHQTPIAIFRLTEVRDADAPYHRWLPAEVSGPGARWLEVNNVIVAAEFRATIVLGLLLYESARLAHAMGFDAVVGVTRLQTLRFFVEFGVVPVDHPPLHLLGRDDINDFLIFYNTRDRDSVRYMHRRAQHWFHQQYVLRCIQARCRRLTAESACGAGTPRADPAPRAAAVEEAVECPR